MTEEIIITNPATSHWLKEQIKLSKSRDIFDALSDAEALVTVLNQRLNNYENLKSVVNKD